MKHAPVMAYPESSPRSEALAQRQVRGEQQRCADQACRKVRIPAMGPEIRDNREVGVPEQHSDQEDDHLVEWQETRRDLQAALLKEKHTDPEAENAERAE